MADRRVDERVDAGTGDAAEGQPAIQVEPTPRQSLWRQLAEALFLDLPFLVDSRWRHCEYALSRNHDYRVHPADGALSVTIESRPRYRSAAFAFLLLTLIFVTYGPTFAAVCGAGTVWVPRLLYGLIGTTSVALALLALMHSPKGIFQRCARRLRDVHARRPRRYALNVLAGIIVCGGVLVCALLAWHAYKQAFDARLCENAQYSWRALAQFAAIVAAGAGAFMLAYLRMSSLNYARWQSVLIVALWALCWWVLATPTALEADGLPYRHGFGLFAAALFLIPLLSATLARRLFRSVPPEACRDFAFTLQHTELLIERVEPQLSGRRWVNAVVNGPLYHPLHLFFLPSLVAIMASDAWLWTLCIAAFVFSALLLTWGYISVRWHQMVLYIDRWFFSGTPLVISLGVIAFAAARLAGNQYVTTLLGAAAFGVIFMWVLMTYAALWLFEQVINQALGPQLLRILSNCNASADKEEPDFIRYSAAEVVKPLAEKQGRYIALHGSGRLAVVATNRQGRLFHTYGASELFSTLASYADVVEQRCPEQKHLGTRMVEAAHDIDRRIKLYFNVLNLIVLVLVVALLWYTKANDGPEAMQPVVTAKALAPDPDRQFDLSQALGAQARNNRPALIVAASGGGTRAAVYTASALGGLAQLGLSDDIVLMSGVSGGGVALAYYATHKPHLPTAANFDPHLWMTFRDKMAEPFIQDVLEGSVEWRIAGSTPLSSLLVESFERRIASPDRAEFADVRDVGLILNTSITGHPADDSLLVTNAMADPKNSDEHSCLPFALLSGQRLSFTNLLQTQGFPRPLQTRLPDVGFAYVVVSDPNVRILQAAALNANFPPVFPNARVDVVGPSSCGDRRVYHVTDGGATENLGLISALYALNSTIDSLRARKALEPTADIRLPELHIVAVEASALGMDYAQDRGIGTATGGSKERLAGGLTEQLIQSVERQATALTGQETKLHIHYLALPIAFRSRGGVGTHWMLPQRVNITNPRLPHAPEWWSELPPVNTNYKLSASLEKEELFELLTELHAKDADFCTATRARPEPSQVVADWICGKDPTYGGAPDLHVVAWKELVELARANAAND